MANRHPCILVPMHDNDGTPFPLHLLSRVLDNTDVNPSAMVLDWDLPARFDGVWYDDVGVGHVDVLLPCLTRALEPDAYMGNNLWMMARDLRQTAIAAWFPDVTDPDALARDLDAPGRVEAFPVSLTWPLSWPAEGTAYTTWMDGTRRIYLMATADVTHGRAQGAGCMAIVYADAPPTPNPNPDPTE